MNSTIQEERDRKEVAVNVRNGGYKRQASLFFATLRDARLAHGFTQRQAAVQVNKTGSVITEWEKGKHEPRLSDFLAYAELFGYQVVLVNSKELQEEAQPECCGQCGGCSETTTEEECHG